MKSEENNSICGYDVSVTIDRDKSGLYAVGYCPICGKKEESHDHGIGEEHARRITLEKVRAHMILAHKTKDEV